VPGAELSPWPDNFSISVSFGDAAEAGEDDDGEEPAREGEAEDPPEGVAVGYESVSLFEVGDREQ
jgi:hypothetical protein